MYPFPLINEYLCEFSTISTPKCSFRTKDLLLCVLIFRNINKRFQRLESHVVTLARSVAHLSSELRTHNTMVHDLESVKRELREFKENPGLPFPRLSGAENSEFDRFRGWVPSLTNTKRVNKLTK